MTTTIPPAVVTPPSPGPGENNRKTPPGRLRSLGIYALLALLGAIGGLGWLDTRYFACTWLAMIGLFFLAHGTPAPIAFRRGVVISTFGIGTAFSWVPLVVHSTLSLSYFNSVLLYLVFVVWDGVMFGLMMYAGARLQRLRWWPTLLYPMFFVALEYVWPRIFPWRMGQSQLGWLELVQVAEITGVYGVSFLVVWGAAVLGLLLQRLLRKDDRIIRNREVGLFAVSLAGVLVFGAVRISQMERLAARQPAVDVALVQVNVFEVGMHEQLQALSRSVASEVDLVCWPETSVGVFSSELRHFRSEEEIRKHCRSEPEDTFRPLADPGCWLLCVGKTFAPGTPERGPYHVTAFLVDKQENIAACYHKRTLLPLGEYVPGQSIFPYLAELALLRTTVAKGESAQIIELPGKAKLGTLICYEDMVAANARESVQEGAEILICALNGAAFGETPAMVQHQQLSQLRAVENRRYMLRCSSTGRTSVISPTGRIESQAKPHTAAALTVTAHPMSTVTVYTRLGDAFSYGCIAMAISAIVLHRLGAKRSRIPAGA